MKPKRHGRVRCSAWLGGTVATNESMKPKAKLNPEKLMALANLAADELLKRLAKVPTKCLPIVVGICIDKAEQMRTRDQTLVARIRALLDAKVSPRQVARLCRVSVHTVNMVKGVVPPNDPDQRPRP